MPNPYRIAVDCDYQSASVEVETKLFFTEFLKSLQAATKDSALLQLALHSTSPGQIYELPGVESFPKGPAPYDAVLSLFNVETGNIFLQNIPQITVLDHLAPMGLKEKLFDTWSPEEQQKFRARLSFYDKPTLVLTSADWVRREALTWSAYSPHYVRTIGGGVPEDFLSVDSTTSPELLRQLGVNGRYILSWLDDEMFNGFELTFAAFVEIQTHFPDCCLLVCYRQDFPLLPKIRQWCSENLRADIIFHKTVNRAEIKNLLAEAVCLSHPVEYDGFNTKIVSAMSQACPVLTTRSSSLPEIAADTALYTNVGDASELAKQMHFLLSDAGNRSTIKNRTFLRSQEFRWSGVAERAISLISEWLPSATVPIFIKANL